MQNVFIHTLYTVGYVCNPYLSIYMSSVHLYMPAMQLNKLSCCMCQDYIYNFRVCSCLC